MRNRKIRVHYRLIAIFLTTLILFQSLQYFSIKNQTELSDNGKLLPSAEEIHVEEWIKNNNFTTQDYWFQKKGDQGNNETIEAEIDLGNEQANYKIMGEELNFTLYGIPNSTDSPDWYEFAKPGYYLPDSSGIDSFGSWVSHTWAEGSNQFPGVHWRKNISIPVDMAEYNITSANLSVLFNASVETTSGNGLDGFDVSLSESDSNQFGIGDFITFYVMISDIDLKNPYVIAFNRTTDLGQDSPTIANISGNIYTYDESVIITALNSAFEKDLTHSNLTITLGIDIYSEDNWGSDRDVVNYAYFEECNLTFIYERKIEKFTSVSWNQIGNKFNGTITEAKLNFRVKIDQLWPTSLSPFSEIRILINNNQYGDTLRLSIVNTTYDDAKVGGFDVSSLILINTNITLSIQVFIANTFALDHNITISIDDVFLTLNYTKTVPDIETVMELYLNNENKTGDPVIEVPYGMNLNITIKYLEKISTSHIPNATIQLTGKVSGQLIENLTYQQYTIIVNTSQLDIGVKSLTIRGQEYLYESQEIQFFSDVIERESNLELYLNGVQKNDDDKINVVANEKINITLYYKDNFTKEHLSGATVTLSGFGQINETSNRFNLTVNSNDLNSGINVLIITAQKDNFQTQTIQFLIEVVELETELLLFLNSNPKNDSDTIKVQVNDLVNITIFYRDNLTKNHLSGANVMLLGIGLLNETNNHYNLIINTIDMAQGINVLTITADLKNYQTQIIQFLIEVIEIDTILQLFLNGAPTNDSDTIQVEVTQMINVTIYFKDNITNQHISGATVQLEGFSLFNETSNNYNFTLKANELEQGITILTLIAQANNYQSQTIQFFVEVFERASIMYLFMNGINKTSDPFVEIPINSLLNITVIYIDNETGLHISGATIQLESDEISLNFTEVTSLQHYYVIIDTSLFTIGVKLFTIYAFAPNYEIKIIDARVTLNKIPTIINSESGTSLITIQSGENVTLRIILNDSLFGGLIKGANVTYSWVYGQEVLEDLDNDGIYEVIIENIPVGSYIITITALAGDQYDVEKFFITLTAITEVGPDLTWLVFVLVGAILGVVGVFSAYQLHFKYPPMVRKVRKIKKSVKKGRKTKPILVSKREEILKNNFEDHKKLLGLEPVTPEIKYRIDKNSIKKEV